MESSLREALEAGDDERLKRICRRIDTNFELTVGGYKGFFNEERTQTVAHHVTCKSRSLQCLRLLIDRLGPDCLSCRNDWDETAVHLAAQHQDDSWMELIRDTRGKSCLQERTWHGETVAHYAAMNEVSNASLKWLVKECGRDCLTVPDKYGHTAVHLAAEWESADSLQFLFEQLGPRVFSMTNKAGETLADCVKKDCDSYRKESKQNWIASHLSPSRNLRPAVETVPASAVKSSSGHRKFAAPAGTEATVRDEQLKRSESLLDPSFTSWEFILSDGKKQVIGAGGFGRVYKALTDRFQTVAVKVVKLEGAKQSGDLERAIEQERRGIESLRDVRHPNILQFLKCERTKDGKFCIFTELVTGHSLTELMERQRKPVPESGVKNFSRQICSGLNFLHSRPQPVLHRDIKCSNVMLTNDGVIKLIDFGLAKELLTSCGLSTNPSGTCHFMAPELFGEQGAQYSIKTDVWALGCTVFEMTEMRPPNGDLAWHQIPLLRQRSREMPQISEQLSENLRDFYRRCVTWEVRERPDTAELLRHSFLSASSN